MNIAFKRIFPRTNTTRMLFFIFSDIVFIIISVYLAFLFRFDGSIPDQYFPMIQKVAVLALVFLIPVFYFSRLYSFSWSYISTGDLVSLTKATSFGFLFLAIALYISKDSSFFYGFPRSTLFISYFLVFFFCGGIRFAKRIYLQSFSKEAGLKDLKRILIIGAGDAGEQVLRSILTIKENNYFPVGFIDDNPAKKGQIIHGVKVLAGMEKIKEQILNNKIAEIIIALPSDSKVIKRAVELSREAGIKDIKIIPSLFEIINNDISVKNIRDVQIEDLLGREPISLDSKTVAEFICNKSVLITGAAGSIGSELSRQVAKFSPACLVVLDQDETGIFNIAKELKEKFPKLKNISVIADVQDKERLEFVFNELRPSIVFHAAAYKHVPLMEECPVEAVKNNIFGTRIAGEAAIKCGAEKFIFISTDKAINPTSVMGATKRAGEMICQTLNKLNGTKFISVRFGNVLDSRGSVIPIFREQIKRKGPVEVTHPDMKRYFMMNSEACLLVMQAGVLGQGGEVFVLDMGEPVKIIDLAKEMIKLSGLEPDQDIPIVFTGIRPGEKLFEEILSAEEGVAATQNNKIFTAKLSEIREANLKTGLEKIKGALKQGKKEEIVAALKGLVPSYKPDSLYGNR